MSILVYLLFYLCVLIFISAVVYRIVQYMRLPIHLRWELYPVPHEGKEKFQYGGSYLEETDWWDKPRKISKIEELKTMFAEIVFLKATWENNRSLWYATYPFHIGLYLISLSLILLLGAAIVQAVQAQPAIAETTLEQGLMGLTTVLAPIGLVICLLGAVALLAKRMTDPGLANYSSFSHYFNLGAFVVVAGLALITWAAVDPSLEMTRAFFTNLLSANPQPVTSPLLGTTLALGALLGAYIPLTHMSHFFMKYFLYHDIRWGDESSYEKKGVDQKLAVVLNYPVKWSAEHIGGDGTRTWADIATTNPMDESEKQSQ